MFVRWQLLFLHTPRRKARRNDVGDDGHVSSLIGERLCEWSREKMKYPTMDGWMDGSVNEYASIKCHSNRKNKLCADYYCII